MNKNKKQRRIMLLLILILGITIGFALLSTTLKINGNASIKSNTWNIHWNDESINVNSGSVEANLPVVSKTTSNKDTVSFDVELELPGDYYEFEIDAINEGSIDGALDLAENWITYKIEDSEATLPSYMDFKVTYDDNTTPTSGDVLRATESKTYKIRVEYKSSVEELPENPEPINIEVEIPYIQHKDTCAAPVSFSTDSWETIACNVKKGNTSAYNVGDTKSVDMGTYGTHTVRVANKSTPSECSGTDFSQTACGFVVEFSDIITEYRMNPYSNSANTNGDGNRGGWEYSDMRAYLNSGKYLEGETGEIDYTSSGIYNALPSELRNIIIDTKVISGYGSKDISVGNFDTKDKIYLLSPHEVLEDIDENTSSGIDYLDKSYSNTRQLDYYKVKGVTTSNYSEAIKKYNGSNYFWWLRSASFESDNYFLRLNRNGACVGGVPLVGNGVSPAFRIG